MLTLSVTITLGHGLHSDNIQHHAALRLLRGRRLWSQAVPLGSAGRQLASLQTRSQISCSSPKRLLMKVTRPPLSHHNTMIYCSIHSLEQQDTDDENELLNKDADLSYECPEQMYKQGVWPMDGTACQAVVVSSWGYLPSFSPPVYL